MATILQHIRTTPEWALTDAEAAALELHGQFYAAGFMAGDDVSADMRYARAIESYLRNCPIPEYDGGPLYPSAGWIWTPPGLPQILWQFYVDLGRSPEVADLLMQSAETDTEREALRKAKLCSQTYPVGGGYTHSIANYGRVLAEGLEGYRTRISSRLAQTADEGVREMYRSLLVVISAIDTFRGRVAAHLDSIRFDDPAKDADRIRLAAALEGGLPMRPAVGFYEAMVSTSFVYAIDGPDDLGRFDQFMWPYYHDDRASGRLSREEAVRIVGEIWAYMDTCSAWNVAIGGTTRDGSEASNDLTLVCMEAAKGRRRPNLALRLRDDTPESIWDGALDCIATGAGLPALYCEENYLNAMDAAHLGVTDEDKRDFAFGGCTELMVHGCSNVGSLEGDFSVIKVLEDTLHRSLETSASFDDLMNEFEADLRREIGRSAAAMSHNQETRSQYVPLPIRTLLIDDCIDRGRNYSDGGARYNWSIVNIVGLSNAIDSLSAVRTAVYEEKAATAEALLQALRDDFQGHEDLQSYLKQCPRFGNDDPAVNELADRLSGVVYREFKRYAPWRGGKFLCGTLMFVTYGWFGEPVGATPDGRRASTPVADSAGPVQGRDTSGPTAMLRSTASLQQQHAPGTLVVNLRVGKTLLTTTEGRARLKALIRGYFTLGGLQLQVNVVDQQVLRDAIDHPEDHQDLIIRVGGYSEYFNNLPPDLKLTILERTEHV